MKTSIRQNFIIIYLLLIVTMNLLTNYYGTNVLKNAIIEEVETSMYEEANSIAQEYVSDIYSIHSSLSSSIPFLRKQFISLHALSKTRIWLTKESGVILVDSDTNKNKEGKNINQYNSSFLNNQVSKGTPLGKLLTEESLFVIYPLTADMTTNGYIILSYPMKTIDKQVVSYMDSVIVCFLVFYLILFLLFLYLNHQISKPIRAMTRTVKEYTFGHFDYPMKKVSGHEYQELAAAIQYLAGKMESMNDYQKKFIANISHDFRSPLTSIKGYTEAMIDGTIPAEMQEKYFNIILFETQRLNKLTANLLELNQFESNKMLLEITTFNINNAIKMSTAAFEQQCTEKRISFNLVFSCKDLLVDADINKIEQVLQNLIDNAIKFSHHDSSVEISTLENSGKIFVSVKDHGIGIPKDSVSKVWTRFYKTDLSRGRDKAGTGLGLSITKEIIEAHGEHINVISTEGVGTEFIFTLRATPPVS